MEAEIGDELVVHSRHVGDHDRRGRITKIGAHGSPPYVVQWEDGKEVVFFPSTDCTVQHREAASSAAVTSPSPAA
jgi:hypothetical protein